MSPTDLQAKLGKTIPDGALSVTDRFKRYWGVGTINYRPNPDALRAARYEFYDNSTAEQRAAAKLKAVDQIAAVNENIDKLNRYYEPYDSGKTAAQARQATRPPGYPLFPITQQHIQDAERRVRDLEVAARSSATTTALVSPENTYDVRSGNLAEERQYLAELKRQFVLQETKYPGAQFYPPFRTDNVYAVPAPPLTPSQMSQYDRRGGGGKSKRSKRSKTCKSKRVKRSKTCKNRVHKRRN
jgi:hypothetical protein